MPPIFGPSSASCRAYSVPVHAAADAAVAASDAADESSASFGIAGAGGAPEPVGGGSAVPSCFWHAATKTNANARTTALPRDKVSVIDWQLLAERVRLAPR